MQELLNSIEQKAKKLNQRVKRLEQENKELKDSVFTYLQQLDEHKKQIQHMLHQEKNKQIAENIVQDKKALQKEIDKYLLLIEKCIATVKVTSN